MDGLYFPLQLCLNAAHDFVQLLLHLLLLGTLGEFDGLDLVLNGIEMDEGFEAGVGQGEYELGSCLLGPDFLQLLVEFLEEQLA